jgi:hypothetical protein
VLCEAGRFSRNGVVVTGSRLERGRAGAHVAFGEELAGRALETGLTTLERERAAAPIAGQDGTVGVVTATTEDWFDAVHVARLERLAADVGHKLAASLSETA